MSNNGRINSLMLPDVSTENAARLIAEFVRENTIDVLNVAGPRQSEWAKGYDYTTSMLEAFVNSIANGSRK